jgi:alkylhydroperoxidase family enzyme
MPRVEPLSRAQADADTAAIYDRVFGPGRDPVTDPGTSTGTPGTWWTAWAKTPGILSAFSAFPMGSTTLDAGLRELALIRTGYTRQSQFVYSQHCKAGRAMGVAEAKIKAVPCWTLADCFSEVERAVLAFVDGQILEGGRVHDRVFEVLHRHLSDEEILALTYVINMYALHATATRALRLEYDDVPDRIVEIPAPARPGVQDWRDAAWAAGEKG